MTVSTSQSNTLGDWALLAVSKHFDKVLSHEANVLVDRDPEDLHQMRVGMRRLRSAMTGFAPVIDLPKPAQEKNVGKIARILGQLRDLDVLREALVEKYQPALPAKEKKILDKALAQMSKQRNQTFAKVKKTLEDDLYQSLKQALTKWLKQPTYHPISQIPIQEVLPDLLLPEISKLLLHPGWLVGCEVKEGEVFIPQDLPPEKVEQILISQGLVLHDLRKEAKRARYQMEVFSQFYETDYHNYLEDVKEIQSILGRIQDTFVLAEFLTNTLGNEVKKSLPNLADKLTQTSYESWQEWQVIHQRFMQVEIRKKLHTVILQPSFNQNNTQN